MIMIVDDHCDTPRMLCRLLHRRGHECCCASGSDEAMEMIRRHPSHQPLLVVLDDMMPGMSGLGVLRAIRDDPKLCLTPVIMYSADSDSARQDAASKLGALAWMVKGCVGESISRVVECIEAAYTQAKVDKLNKPTQEFGAAGSDRA